MLIKAFASYQVLGITSTKGTTVVLPQSVLDVAKTTARPRHFGKKQTVTNLTEIRSGASK